MVSNDFWDETYESFWEDSPSVEEEKEYGIFNIWITKRGEVLNITEMESSHLKNKSVEI